MRPLPRSIAGVAAPGFNGGMFELWTIAAAVGPLVSAVYAFRQQRRAKAEEALWKAAAEEAKPSREQGLVGLLGGRRPPQEKADRGVEQAFAEAKSGLDSTMDLIQELKAGLDSDLDKARRQVEEQHTVLEALRAEAAQREEFLEATKSDVLVVETLGAKIEGQNQHIERLTRLLTGMEERAGKAERRAGRLAWVTFGLSTVIAVGMFVWQLMLM